MNLPLVALMYVPLVELWKQ